MKRQKIIETLQEADILEELADGPTALLAEDTGGRDVLLLVTRAGDWVEVTTGDTIQHTTRIPIKEIMG